MDHLKKYLHPPDDPLALARWIFLLGSLATAVLTGLILLREPVLWGPLRWIALLGLVWLCFHFIRGYERQSFPFVLSAPEGLVVFAVTLATPTPDLAISLLYVSLVFRSLYGTRREVLLTLLAFLGAYCGAIALSLWLSYLAEPLGELLPHVIGLALITIMFHLLATVFAQRERILAHERVLREAGADLVATRNRDSVYTIATDAALELAGESPKARVGLVVGTLEEMVVVASAGDHAPELIGKRLGVHALPDSLRERLLAKQSVVVGHSEAEELRSVLEISPSDRPFFTVPLFVEEELRGILTAASDSAFSQEVKDDLEALGFQVALALESVAFAEDRHWRQSQVRFRTLIQNSSDIVVILDEDGAIDYVSPSVRRVLGYDHKDLVGKDAFAFPHPDDVARVRRFFTDLVDTPDANPTLQTRLRHLDGSWRCMEGVGNNLLDDPDIRGVVINLRDVTDRKRAEEESQLLRNVMLEVSAAEDLDSALRISLRRVCEATGWVIGQVWIPSSDGTVLECSPAWYAGADGLAGFRATNEGLALAPGVGTPGLAWSTKQPVWTRDISESSFLRARIAAESGLKAAMDIPVLAGAEVVAVLDFLVFEQREEDRRLIEMVSGIAAQLGSAVRRKQAEEALRKSEARNRAIVDTASDAIVTMTGDGLIQSFNRAAEGIFGYTTEEVVGQPLRMLMPERFREAHEAGYRRYLESGEAHIVGKEPVELTGLRKSGEEFPLELSLGETREGEERLFTGILRDITERKRVDDALREREFNLAEAQRIAHLGSWETNLRTGEMRWSDEMYRVFGFSPGEVSPSREVLANATHPEDIGLVAEATRNSVDRRQPFSFEHRVIWPDGEVRFVQARGEAIFDSGGEPVKLVGTTLDITERKRVEEALRQSESRLLVAQRIARVGDWSFDVTGNEAYWSDEMYRIFGLDPQQEPTLTYKQFLSYVHPNDRRLIREASREALSGKSQPSIDYRVVRPDGEVRFVYAQYEVQRDSSGRAVALIGTLQDVTDLRQAEVELEEQAAQLREQAQILDLAPVLIRTLEDDIVFWNTGAEQMYGWPEEEALGKVSHELLQSRHPEPRDRVRARVIRDGRWEGEITHTRRDGTVVVVASLQVLHRDEHGEPAAILEVNNDITERKKVQDELSKSEERFRSLVQNSLDVITVVDAASTILYYSPSVEAVMGYKPEELVGKNALEALPIHPEDLSYTEGILGYLLEEPGANYTLELRMRHADGSWRTIEATASNLLHNPSIGGIVINSRDVTERKRAEEQLEHQAFHDDLSGLPNRALFTDRLEHALARLDRHHGRVAVLFLDLDNFKVVNDSLGHTAGDELLVEAAGRMQECLRPADTVARLGGDEFIVLLEDIKEESDATRLAERLAGQLRAPFELQNQKVHVTASVGIAFGAASDRPDDLLRKADVAMYRAKNRGKAHHRVFDTHMDAEARERLSVETDLRQAIEREEFRVYYQPQLLVESGDIFGFEALVRWEHPERGLVPPLEFIPVAEETGLIQQIGQWVLREACRQAREWREQDPYGTPVMVSVNLSARQFQHPGLTQAIARILEETGVDAHLLCLEITESVAMEEAPFAVETLSRLKDIGVNLAIDDFGTGYSSLSYLERFPSSYLKIDRSFINGLREDSRTTALVSGIRALAHTLEMQVIAEGVETAGQLQVLRNLGCNIAQGFYFHKPLPGEAATSLLSRKRRHIER